MPFYSPDADQSFMARQAVINGNFDIWQRGTSFTPANGDYMADRWVSLYNTDGGTLPTDTFTRQAQTPGALDNSFYFNRLTVDGAGSSFGVSSYYDLVQKIEHGTRLLCGASKTVTVSFWARSDITDKKFGVYLKQQYGTGGSPTATEDITGEAWTLTSSWVKYTHTFTTNTLTGKTFGTDNNDALQVRFRYIWGTTTDADVGETTAEDFVGAGDIDIAQVQLCEGSIALPFQPRTFAREHWDCEYYYQKSYDYTVNPGTSGDDDGQFMANSGTNTSAWVQYSVPLHRPMRAVPTITTYDGLGASGKISTVDQGTSETDGVTPTSVGRIGRHSFQISHNITTEAGIKLQWTASSVLA